MLLEQTSSTKRIELKNGYVEILNRPNEAIRKNDTTFYKFLAKLLVEDKNLQTKK